MAILSATTISVILAVIALSWYLLTSSSSSKLPLPPGPPKLPIIGNLHQAPTEWPWRTFREWGQKYGPVMYLQFGGDTIIMLNNHTAATDLLEKRGNIYSSRPRVVMGQENVSKGMRTLFLPYGPQYRRHQRIQGSLLIPKMSNHYVSLQDLESKQLIHDLLSTTGTDWMGRIHRYSSSLIFSLAFGKRMPRGDEIEVQKVHQLMENILYAARVGTWICDAIPILNKLPKFLAPWKKIGDEFHEYESTFYMEIVAEAKSSPHWNWTKEAMRMKESKEMGEKEFSYVVSILYEAGSDTTTQALHTFVLAACLHPGIMKEAQAEIDQVVCDRFPTFEDRGKLPYVEAIMKEVLRWRPVSVGGIPHAVTEDDEYMGYHIPKGATVIGNHWSIDLDEAIYGSDAESFRPRRYIEDPGLPLSSFGWGRRVCTGQHIALNSLYINIARMLWSFHIEGVGKLDSLAYTQGFNSGPLPFEANFKVRDSKRKETIEREWDAAEKDIGVLLDDIRRTTRKA